MKTGQASRTAEAAAAFRASHTLYAEKPILEDKYAYSLTGRFWRFALSNRFTHWLAFNRLLKRLSPVIAQVLVRSRYAEDSLAAAMKRDIDQYVIIGAGLDSFSLRHSQSAASSLRILELDHPDTQASKRQRLQSLNLALPAALEFVGVDFERQSIAAALATSGFRKEVPAFFSWLGTTHYLTRQAITGTLLSIAEYAAPGSEIVLDYSITLESIDVAKRADLLWVAKLAERMGEPIIGGIEPGILHSIVSEMGYDIIEDLSSEDQKSRYFFNRRDRLSPTTACRLLHLRLSRDGYASAPLEEQN